LDRLPRNIFVFVPSYDFQAKKMLAFLYKKFGKINNILTITEVDRVDLLKYKLAYEKLFKNEKIKYDQINFIGNDPKIENKLDQIVKYKHYNFIFVFSGAVGATKIITRMNDHKTVFVGTENFGSSTYPSVYVRLKDKIVKSFIIRNIDFLKMTSLLEPFSKAYKARYSTMPSPLSAYTYDAMKIILKTYEKYNSVNVSDILRLNYHGITGIVIKGNKLYRSNQFVILSISEKGFINEQ
jgi:ABC-type branched-subunit amino acid transport system substrate-binding protein